MRWSTVRLTARLWRLWNTMVQPKWFGSIPKTPTVLDLQNGLRAQTEERGPEKLRLVFGRL
jgi:hypothetical protein